MIKYHINSEAWRKIHTFVQKQSEIQARNKEKLRKFCEAIWYIANSGVRWRLLPKEYGHFRAVHKSFLSWACKKNIWRQLIDLMRNKEVDMDIKR